MKSLLYVCCSILVYAFTASADVVSWRNGGNGHYSGVGSSFNWDNPEAVLWKIDTPIKSNACPILVGGRLVYCAEPTELICADARTGAVIWRSVNGYEEILAGDPGGLAEIEKAKGERERIDLSLEPLKREQYRVARLVSRRKDDSELNKQLDRLNEQIAVIEASIPEVLKQLEKPLTKDINGYASYTPCSDGEYIYSCNGLGIVSKHDFEGKRLWIRQMEAPDHAWGGASSPILVDGKLIVRFADYVALDPNTGDELWRIGDPVSFGTPTAFSVEDDWFLTTCRGELFRVRDGVKLPSHEWTIVGKEHAFFNTNAVLENRIYAVHGASNLDGQSYCLEIPDTVAELEREGLREVWNTPVFKDRYYASPLAHEGLVYLLSRNSELHVLDMETGEMVYRQKVPGLKDLCYAGLILVGDKIYFSEENGTAVLIEPGRSYREIARFQIGECRSTPIFDGDRAYLRSIESVFAFRML